MGFSMNITTENNYSVIHLVGEFDVYSVPQVKEQIHALFDSGMKALVYNLTDTDYVDSSGLGHMISTLKKIKEMNGNLVVVCPSERMRRMFEITGLDRIFDIKDTVREAGEFIAVESTKVQA